MQKQGAEGIGKDPDTSFLARRIPFYDAAVHDSMADHDLGTVHRTRVPSVVVPTTVESGVGRVVH